MVESQHQVDDADDLYDDVLSPYLRDGDLLYEPSKLSYLLEYVVLQPLPFL